MPNDHQSESETVVVQVAPNMLMLMLKDDAEDFIIESKSQNIEEFQARIIS